MQEVEDTLVTFLERGASVETDTLSVIKAVLPPEVTKQLDELIPPPPNAQQQVYDTTVSEIEPPLVIYTADSVLENQIGKDQGHGKRSAAVVDFRWPLGRERPTLHKLHTSSCNCTVHQWLLTDP